MKQRAPAAERNRGPIADALAPWLEPLAGDSADRAPVVLELAAGTGTHTAWLAARFAHLRWWPTDIDPAALASVEARRVEAGCPNIAPARRLDVTERPWSIEQAPGEPTVSAVFNANMIHIAPWAAAEGLFAGAGRVLRPGGRLFVYGPFRFDGVYTAPSNAAFDRRLRARDPRWGVRDLADLRPLAEAAGLSETAIVPMPANNHLLVFTRRH